MRIPRLARFSARAVAASGIFAAVLVLTSTGFRAQSLSYSSGQNVSPAFEGWETDASGNSYFVFGYMNNNWDEEIDVPVGADNSFNLLGADLGQPTHFLPRRNRFMFKVPVPKDFGTKELVWTLKTSGVTEKAYATLRQDYFIDNVVIASETGALGPGSSSPEIRANKPPVVKIEGGKTRTAKVGQPLELVAIVTDDGVPKAPGQGAPMPNAQAIARRIMMPPRRITVGKMSGLHLSWFVYRGKATAEFAPEQVKVWEDTRSGANSPWAPIWFPPPVPAEGRYLSTVTFTEPGSYVLRARADDGALMGDQELTVTVSN